MLAMSDKGRMYITQIEVQAVSWQKFCTLCREKDMSPSGFIRRIIEKEVRIAKKGEKDDAG